MQVRTAIQPKSDVKTPAGGQTGKDVKNMPAIPGDAQGRQPEATKPAPEVKATVPAPSPKPMVDVKTGPSTPAKTGTEVKNAGTANKPGVDVKTGSTSKKTDTDMKNQKGTSGKQGANLKSGEPQKSGLAKDRAETPHEEVIGKSGFQNARQNPRIKPGKPREGRQDSDRQIVNSRRSSVASCQTKSFPDF